MIKAVSATSAELLEGDRWLIQVQVLDDMGYQVAEAPVVTVTSPSAVVTTPTVELVEYGTYKAAVTVSEGRYVAVAAASGRGATAFVANVSAITTAAQMPTVTDVEDYLSTSDEGTSFTTDQLQDALDAETAAQQADCEIPASYPASLRQALLRRVARNLTLNRNPMSMPRGDAEIPSSMRAGRDPMVLRLEGPYRKVWGV